MKTQVEVRVRKVRRGFPFIVKGNLCPAEPDVGLMEEYFDDVEFLTNRGRPADFLCLTDVEEQALISAALQEVI